MKTGSEPTALDLMNSAITTDCFFWKANADIDLLPGAISSFQLLLSRWVARNISEVKKIAKIYSKHLMNSSIP